ncbi:hypothetical protein PanWU01x14_036640 [Parasponia andersonii]|uniref:Uncharacterized protein n=1 Tax=Parasponia andersonii TaxID=3476 RepID=A0A2P5DSI4_PARAD|nr:hypothetical protein PanWU01x14_036640 [Parasponia andersonii]
MSLSGRYHVTPPKSDVEYIYYVAFLGSDIVNIVFLPACSTDLGYNVLKTLSTPQVSSGLGYNVLKILKHLIGLLADQTNVTCTSYHTYELNAESPILWSIAQILMVLLRSSIASLPAP